MHVSLPPNRTQLGFGAPYSCLNKVLPVMKRGNTEMTETPRDSRTATAPSDRFKLAHVFNGTHCGNTPINPMVDATPTTPTVAPTATSPPTPRTRISGRHASLHVRFNMWTTIFAGVWWCGSLPQHIFRPSTIFWSTGRTMQMLANQLWPRQCQLPLGWAPLATADKDADYIVLISPSKLFLLRGCIWNAQAIATLLAAIYVPTDSESNRTAKPLLVKSDTNLKTFVVWNAEIFRKLEKRTSWSCSEFENIRRYTNVNIFKIPVIVWSSKVRVNMTIMFAQNLNTEVRTTGAIGYSSLRCQRVRRIPQA